MKVNDVYEYNILTNEWNIKKNNIQIPDLDSHNAFIYEDDMYIFGGYSSISSSCTNSLLAFNLTNFYWRIVT